MSPEEGMHCKKSERAISDAHRCLLKSKKKKKNHKNQSANKIKNNGECHEWDIWHFHNDLPDFAQEGRMWRKLFLPTLYDGFFASDEPFAKFIKGSQPFVAFLQTTVGLVYLKVSYKVTSKDAIHLLVCFHQTGFSSRLYNDAYVRHTIASTRKDPALVAQPLQSYNHTSRPSAMIRVGGIGFVGLYEWTGHFFSRFQLLMIVLLITNILATL